MGAIASSAIQSSAQRKQANENNRLAVEQSDKQYQYDMEAMHLQRSWDLEDRQFAIDNPTVIKGEVDYEQMVASAEKAGINPLTALRNGGSAGFSASSQPSAPLSRTAPTRQAPHLQAAPASSPLAAGIGGFLENFDPFADQKRELEYGLVQAQIANLNASTAGMINRPASFNVPSYGAKSGEQRGSGAAGALSSGRMTSTGLGISWGVDPLNTPAQEIEDQYAELPANIVGTFNWARDMFQEYSGLSWDSYQLPTLSDWRDGWNNWADYNYKATRKAAGRSGGNKSGGGGW